VRELNKELFQKINNFILKNNKIVVFLLCLGIVALLLLVFQDGYSMRGEEFSEIQQYILEIREKDKEIFNTLMFTEIKTETNGIDVSAFQGDIDWEKVKESNLDFVMIRCGYRNLTNDEIHEDSKFRYNISEANRLGIPVGVYFYSTARNELETYEEATFVLNLIKDYEVLYPVVYDFELYNTKRMTGVSSDRINDNASYFLDYIALHGYKVMLYSNNSYLERVWNQDNYKEYKFWLAQYDGEVTREYDMLQYSDQGTIEGIEGYVDLDKATFKYEKISKN
jgi:GH25 family lysozyme M1 (1,4-beta-N-acetylmuramidase)